jgi:hypothetical protein
MPIVFVSVIIAAWFILRQRILRSNTEDHEAALAAMSSKAIHTCIIFLYTVFPMVSTTIFQVFIIFATTVVALHRMDRYDGFG